MQVGRKLTQVETADQKREQFETADQRPLLVEIHVQIWKKGWGVARNPMTVEIIVQIHSLALMVVQTHLRVVKVVRSQKTAERADQDLK